MTPIVLGIDAAWTETQPSGVALARKCNFGWELVRASPSYCAYIAADDGGSDKPTGNLPRPAELLAASEAFAGGSVDIVAIDMPLSHEAIISRRTSDDLISKAYGSRYAATHTASATRPGSISTFLRDGFALEGYPLLVETPVRNGLIEVYPHPALIEFCDLPLRAPYKFGKIRKYWPEKTVAQRKANIVGEWDRIRSHLRSLFFNLNDVLPGFIDFDGPSWSWKAYEDKIDAVVCAAVGICALQGSAEPYGDCKSAIWVPKPGTMLPRRDAN